MLEVSQAGDDSMFRHPGARGGVSWELGIEMLLSEVWFNIDEL